MKKIKIEKIKKGDYICCDVEKENMDLWIKTFFKITKIEKGYDNTFKMWGKKWLDIFKNSKKEICNTTCFVSGDGKREFYKLTKKEFIKITSNDFMLNELGDKNETNKI